LIRSHDLDLFVYGFAILFFIALKKAVYSFVLLKRRYIYENIKCILPF